MLNRILISIIMISFAVAQPSFTAADIATSADYASSVFVADMDNDGDMDIVSASYNDATIAWYENDSLYTFIFNFSIFLFGRFT